MKKIYALVLCFAAALPAFAFPAGIDAGPQAATPAPSTSQPAAAPTWTIDQAVTCSVREAWALGGRNEQGFFAIVKALAELSAQKRGITLPDNAEVGHKFGLYIKTHAKADHDQSLYSIVDHAVRIYGTKAASTAGQ